MRVILVLDLRFAVVSRYVLTAVLQEWLLAHTGNVSERNIPFSSLSRHVRAKYWPTTSSLFAPT
jgi:hypothetical protein